MHSQSDYNRLNLLSRRAEEVMNQGDFDAARRFATEMFSLDPNNLAGFLVYTNSGRMSADDPVTQRLLAIGDGKALDRPIRTMILFLQGKALDDLGDHKAAFDKFVLANSTYRGQTDHKATRKRVTQVLRNPPAHRDPLPPTKPRMVFVLGMPRSGTSLTTQILSAHSGIVSVGEQTSLALAVNKPRGIPNPQTVAAFATADLEQMRQDYFKRLPQDAVAQGLDGKILVDKLPGNYWSAFAIPILFPDALIIHSHRDKLASCWSCYRNHFGTGHDYAYDFKDTLSQYDLHLKLCETWKTYAAPGQWIDMQFEDVVGRTRETIEPVLNKLGLDWEEACLNPSAAKTEMNTISRWQVRQGIKPSIAQAWKVYEPLIRAKWNVRG